MNLPGDPSVLVGATPGYGSNATLSFADPLPAGLRRYDMMLSLDRVASVRVTVRQLRHHFEVFLDGFELYPPHTRAPCDLLYLLFDGWLLWVDAEQYSTPPPRARRVTCSTWCPCLLAAVGACNPMV